LDDAITARGRGTHVGAGIVVDEVAIIALFGERELEDLVSATRNGAFVRAFIGVDQVSIVTFFLNAGGKTDELTNPCGHHAADEGTVLVCGFFHAKNAVSTTGEPAIHAAGGLIGIGGIGVVGAVVALFAGVDDAVAAPGDNGSRTRRRCNARRRCTDKVTRFTPSTDANCTCARAPAPKAIDLITDGA
jgi:hypothetical protein